MTIHLNVLLVLFLSMTVYSQTALRGILDDMTLQKEGNPHIVVENITVPAGKMLSISEGCVLLFKPFTGLTVEGSLEVNGTTEEPVIFTSINDSVHNPQTATLPAPFDWNGIVISSKVQKVGLTHIVLSYSVYGIKSQTPHLTLGNGLFLNNGQFNFTINDEIQPVTENLPFNYGETRETVAAVESDGKPVQWKRPLLISGEVAGVGGLGAMAYFIYRENIYHEKYSEATVQPEINRYDDKRKSYRLYAIIAGCGGGAAAVVSTLFLRLDIPKRKNITLAIYPIIDQCMGIAVNAQF